jgi:TMEM175 potassium channel family protein
VSRVSETERVYNEVAGSNLARLTAISDGIFAVGMTLLVLGLAVPAVQAVKTEGDLLGQIRDLLPAIVTYFMSFLTLGIFWVGQQTQLSEVLRANRAYTWIHLVFLLSVTLVPFSTQLLARFHWSRVALVVYWLNILVMGTALLVGAEYAGRSGLFPREAAPKILRLVRRRVYGAQALYLVAVLLSVFDPHWSIAVIVAIQLNFAIAPPIPLLRSI